MTQHTPDTQRGGAVSLRPVAADDLPVFFEHQRDPAACAMAAFPARTRDAFMSHWGGILASRAVTSRTVLLDGAVAGNVLAFDYEGRREVGYWIGREWWGRGVATRALAEFLATETTRPIFASVAAGNAGSIRVLEKCGFARCGEREGHVELVLEA